MHRTITVWMCMKPGEVGRTMPKWKTIWQRICRDAIKYLWWECSQGLTNLRMYRSIWQCYRKIATGRTSDRYRKVKVVYMKFGMFNKENIIYQAYSRHLRIYAELGYSERCKRRTSISNDCYRDGNYKWKRSVFISVKVGAQYQCVDQHIIICHFQKNK